MSMHLFTVSTILVSSFRSILRAPGVLIGLEAKSKNWAELYVCVFVHDVKLRQKIALKSAQKKQKENNKEPSLACFMFPQLPPNPQDC